MHRFSFTHSFFTCIHFHRIFFKMYMYVYLSVCRCTICMRELTEYKEGIRFLKAGITDGCEMPCGCWNFNVGPL